MIPVIFHFLVEFQWDKDKASASFAEVEGLSQELILEKGEDGIEFPVGIKVSDITLKRALEPVSERIASWARDAFNFKLGSRIKPCRMLVSLIDSQGNVMAEWTCEWAFPVKWSVSTLNASESKIAIESITLRYKSLRRSG